MRGLVLSGGGSRGPYQLGAIEALQDSGFAYDFVVGTSVGAINACVLSYLPNPGEGAKLWYQIQGFSDLMWFNWQWPWKMEGLFTFEPLKRLLHKIIIEENGGVIRGPEAVACYTDFLTGELKFVSNKEVSPEAFIEAVLASCAIAGIQTSALGYGYDGGHRDVLAMDYARQTRQCEKIHAILTSSINPPITPWRGPWRYFPLLAILLRALEIAIHEIEINDYVKYLSDPEVKFFYPQRGLEYSTLTYKPELIRNTVYQGYVDTKAALTPWYLRAEGLR